MDPVKMYRSPRPHTKRRIFRYRTNRFRILARKLIGFRIPQERISKAIITQHSMVVWKAHINTGIDQKLAIVTTGSIVVIIAPMAAKKASTWMKLGPSSDACFHLINCALAKWLFDKYLPSLVMVNCCEIFP
mmetsp:Transcript_1306/g.2640  ORF Transcript_1306/g.2640 Transcript_1306/m.2640 type:complete len:132 (+) Transcript_1306:794-1189(+)